MIKKQIPRFLVAGCSAVATDFLIYIILSNIISVNFAKSISFIIGASVAFLINKFWTFEKKIFQIKEIYKFATVYLFSLLINIYVNQFLFIKYNNLLLAFLFATAISATINFTTQKFFVFKHNE